MKKSLLIACLFVAALAAAQDKVTLLFGGDAMGHSPQFQYAYDAKTNTYNYEPVFRYIKPYVEAADLAVVNVEVTYGGEPYSGYPNFSTPDAYHDALMEAGFDVMLLANNHILDRGKRGLERTLRVIGEVPNAGAYSDSIDRVKRYPLIQDVKGLRVAIFNCTYGCNGYYPIAPNMVNFIDTTEIMRDMESIQDQAVDLKIMCIHWGVEYELQAVKRQNDIAEWLTQKGFDLVIGGHPHVVENAEMRNNVPVFYSLGNLVSNQRREHTNGGLLVRVEVDLATRMITRAEYLPCYVHKGTITYVKEGENVTERQYFILPTTDYMSGKLPFTLSHDDDAALRRFNNNTRKRIPEFPVFAQ